MPDDAPFFSVVREILSFPRELSVGEALSRLDAVAAPIFEKRKGSWVPEGPWMGLADSMDQAKGDR
jgi:hypothetical protein